MTGLSEHEQALLAFERLLWRHQGAKDQAIKDTFGLSRVRYDQQIRDVISKPAALVHDPVLVKRLLRLQETRERARRAV